MILNPTQVDLLDEALIIGHTVSRITILFGAVN
jgi:hypothetical protein